MRTAPAIRPIALALVIGGALGLPPLSDAHADSAPWTVTTPTPAAEATAQDWTSTDLTGRPPVQQQAPAQDQGQQMHIAALPDAPAAPTHRVRRHHVTHSAGHTYRVRPGDTTWAIAQANGTSVGALVRINGLADGGNLIFPDQIITLP